MKAHKTDLGSVIVKDLGKIDSLSISGKVINGISNEPEMQISVLIIPIAQDSIFGKKKANIFATTDSSGNFNLNYLRPDTYKIYALKYKIRIIIIVMSKFQS